MSRKRTLEEIQDAWLEEIHSQNDLFNLIQYLHLFYERAFVQTGEDNPVLRCFAKQVESDIKKLVVKYELLKNAEHPEEATAPGVSPETGA